MNGHFCADFYVDTLYGTLTRKHRKRVSTLKKWLTFSVKTYTLRRSVLACREVSRTLFLGNPKPFLIPQNIFEKIRFVFGKTPFATVIVAKGTSRPFPFLRKGGERSVFTGI